MIVLASQCPPSSPLKRVDRLPSLSKEKKGAMKRISLTPLCFVRDDNRQFIQLPPPEGDVLLAGCAGGGGWCGAGLGAGVRNGNARD